MTVTEEWTPSFSPWRHGGWYVDNVHYPTGACGCVSRNYDDRKWRIVGGDHDITYANRDAAARAERALTLRLDEATCPLPVLPGRGSGHKWPDGTIAWRCAQVRGHEGPCTESIDTPAERKAR